MSLRDTAPDLRRPMHVLVVLSVVGAMVAAPVAAATVVFQYDTQPTDDARAQIGSTYTHAVSVETNASDGPLMVTLYHDQSSDIAYAGSYDATLGNDSLQMTVSTSQTTIGGRSLTQLTFVNRSPPTNGTETLLLEATFDVSDSVRTESVFTGGVHGPTGTTLSLVETNVSTSGPDLQPTGLSVPSDPRTDTTETLTGTVSNTGDYNASNVAVALLVDGSVVQTSRVDVAAGNSTDVSFEWTPSTEGDRRLSLVVDDDDTVVELNEGNNQLGRTVTVQLPGPESDAVVDSDSGPPASSGGGGGGGGGGGVGPTTLVSVTSFLQGGASQTIDLGTGSIQSMTVTFNETTAGQIRIREFSNPPSDYDPDFQRIATTFRLSGPDYIFNQPGTVEVTLSRASVAETGGSADQLRFEYYDTDNETWQVLDTDVVSTSSNTVTVAADVPRLTPMFVVAKEPGATAASSSGSAQTASATATETPTETATTTPTPTATERPSSTSEATTTTSTQFDGFTSVIALVAMLLATLVAARASRR